MNRQQIAAQLRDRIRSQLYHLSDIRRAALKTRKTNNREQRWSYAQQYIHALNALTHTREQLRLCQPTKKN